MKIGFIGGSGHHYLQVFANRDGYETAIADDGYDPAATRNFANKLPNSPKTYPSAREMLDAFMPDVVSVGSVYAHAAEFAALALERDLPTVSDKPIASSWRDFDALTKLCSANPARKLLTEFDFRARPTFRAARDAVRAGDIGAVILMTAQKSYRWGSRPDWYKTRDHYPSTLLWVASHGIDAMKFVGGAKFTSVVARQGNVSRPDYSPAEDHATATYELDTGGLAIVHADYLRPAAAPTHGDDRLRVAGSKGVLEIRDDKCTLITATEGEQDITPRGGPKAPAGEALMHALTTGDETYYSTKESLESAEILLRSRDAADLGQKVYF